MGVFFQFDAVDAFATTVVGRPGQRTFFLQIRDGETHLVVKCEKQQAASIAQYLRTVMRDLPTPAEKLPSAGLEMRSPIDAVFVLGPIGLGYDKENDRLLVQLEEMVAIDEDGEPDADAIEDRGHIRLFLRPGQAVAFCEHTESVVSAGRPPCAFCGLPMNADGHPCPKMN
jgi:uncharacterized repeat protein (TIGR03847 family)